MHTEDPTRLVEATFGRIARERTGAHNAALEVEAVGLHRWNGHWLGMLVTPWALSVLLLPSVPAAWVSMPPQQRRFVRFPFGDLAFLGGDAPDLGEYQTSALFSPMDRFATQAQARDTARASLAALLTAPPVALPGSGAPATMAARAVAPAAAPALAAHGRFLGLAT